MVVVLVVGALGGALNGVLITRLGLPSIAVTIGTLTLFRGIAEILLGGQLGRRLSRVPHEHRDLADPAHPDRLLRGHLPGAGDHLCASCCTRRRSAARSSRSACSRRPPSSPASGSSASSSCCSSCPGLVCAFAGILWTLRFATSRFDAGTGLELNVVAIVLLGGVSIFGGRGSILGVVLAAAVLACFLEALTLINVSAQVQNIVTGGLLLLSVVVPTSGDTRDGCVPGSPEDGPLLPPPRRSRPPRSRRRRSTHSPGKSQVKRRA